MAGTCMICTSPYRKEVIECYKRRIPVTQIHERYAKKMNYYAEPASLRQMLYRHVTEKHNVDAIILPGETKSPRATIENFAQKFLELGMAKLDAIDPNDQVAMAVDVKFKDVVAAQKLILDSKKLKLTEDAMQAMLGKMFAPIELQEAIEGEVLDASRIG